MAMEAARAAFDNSESLHHYYVMLEIERASLKKIHNRITDPQSDLEFVLNHIDDDDIIQFLRKTTPVNVMAFKLLIENYTTNNLWKKLTKRCFQKMSAPNQKYSL